MLKGLIESRKRGVFASALIKKCQYWPRYMDRNAINAHMAGKPLGAVDALPGQMDNVPFNIFVMKDVEHDTMAAYGRRLMEGYLSRKDKVTLCTQCVMDTTKPLRHSSKYHQPALWRLLHLLPCH